MAIRIPREHLDSCAGEGEIASLLGKLLLVVDRVP